MRGSAGRTGVVTLFVAMVACSSSSTEPAPPRYEALPETAETVQAAVDSFTAGVVPVPASCPTVNCPGGTPGTASVTLTRITATVALQSPRTFAYTATVRVVTPNDIAVTIPIVGACALHIDTRPGADSTMQVDGTATFVTDTAGGTPNRLSFSTPNITKLTADDFSLSGGIGCATASLGLNLYLNTLTGTLAQEFAQLCGAVGPTLFIACPQP